jgi:hypothetical protein
MQVLTLITCMRYTLNTWFYNGLLNTINTYALQVSYFDATTKLLFKLASTEIYGMKLYWN